MDNSHKTWINDKSLCIKKRAYQECKKTGSSFSLEMKGSWWSAEAAELQEYADKKDSNAFYEGLKKVFGPEEKGTSPVLSSDDKTLFTDKEEILSRWKKHCDSVLNSQSVIDEEVIASTPQRLEIPQLSHEPCLKELQNAIKQMSSDKAPGKDGIPPEIFKYGGNKLVKKVLELFKVIWKAGWVPQASLQE